MSHLSAEVQDVARSLLMYERAIASRARTAHWRTEAAVAKAQAKDAQIRQKLAARMFDEAHDDIPDPTSEDDMEPKTGNSKAKVKAKAKASDVEVKIENSG